ncbi:MAG: DUF4404 family protein [Stenotrophobium sp.]
MKKEALRETLEQLRADVRNLKFRDAKSAERVNQLISAIERQLENSDDPAGKASLRENISIAIKQFEVEHPALTVTLDRIVSALSSMGI